jgi:phosphoserine phosphatase
MSRTAKRRFAVFDIDGTLIRWQMFHAIVHHLGKQGYISAAAHNRIREARAQWKRRTTNSGFATYETVLVQEYIAALKDIDQANYEQIVQEVLMNTKTRRLHIPVILFAI